MARSRQSGCVVERRRSWYDGGMDRRCRLIDTKVRESQDQGLSKFRHHHTETSTEVTARAASTDEPFA